MEVKRLFLYLLISIASVPALLRGQMAPGAPRGHPHLDCPATKKQLVQNSMHAETSRESLYLQAPG
jgi:hypothetical protein